MTISIILVFFSSLVLSAAASCAPMRGEQNRMKTSNDWCESNVCVCLCFFPSYLSLSRLSSSLTSHCNVPPLRSTRFISVASSPEQGNIHTYIYISVALLRVCVCVCAEGRISSFCHSFTTRYIHHHHHHHRRRRRTVKRKNIDSKQNAFVA